MTRSLREDPCQHGEANHFFHGVHLYRICGSAENWSGGNAVQWTGSDSCLECLWPTKFRFRSWLQPKVARFVAETVLDYRQFATLGVVVSPQNASVCHFGVFELDLRAGELRKNGVKLRLQEQPYQVLLKLIEHHGGIVSREELRSTLWHEDTFVDFETGLNTAIKRLRETLGDSADNPTFIETVPRRGYKFIATVERPKGEESGIPGPSTPQGSSAKSFLRRSAFIAGVVVIVLICAAVWRSQPQPPTVTNIVRITNDGKAKNPLNPPVTDGVHLYFTEGMPYTTGSGIAQVSAGGGETTWIQLHSRMFGP